MEPATNRRRTRSLRAGFTLVEVLLATAITAIAMSAILATTMAIARAGFRVDQYAEMENQSRKCLELFAQDARMAKSIAWLGTNSIQLTIPVDDTDTLPPLVRTYTYLPDEHRFVRVTGANTENLLTGVDEFLLMGYKVDGDSAFDPAAPPTDWSVVNNDTKQLQLSISCVRTQGPQVRSSQKVISARFILRNHLVAI